ncbi:MAG: DUF1552 domain-containing protein [Myxococcota bacterium]
MPSFKLNRRALLKGLGGVAVGLPVLEAMLDGAPASAQSQLAPKRYLVAFHGGAIGSTSKPGNVYVPSKVGFDYDLKTALAPLANHDNIKNEISVISGLRIPTSADTGGVVPPAGRRTAFHISSSSPLFTGVRSPSSGSTDYGQGESSDWLVANAIGQGTPHKVLAYRVQVAAYRQTTLGARSTMSTMKNSNGNIVPYSPTVSPAQAFTSLFGAFTGGGTTVDPAADRAVRARKSVLDLVRADTAELLPKLGDADQERLSGHFDEIRDLENRIAAVPPPVAATGTCVKPVPPVDPTIGSTYSNEDERARVFCDLIHMAFACDLARSASLMFTMFQSFMNMNPLIGVNLDLHEIGHASNAQLCTTENVGKIIAWHMKHFGYLVAKFRDTPEGNGKMIDNVAAVFLSEAGHGRDPASPQDIYSSHCTDNMVALLAGRAGGLRPGQHVVATGMHPGNVVLTAMRAVGFAGSSFGEVTGELPQLRS